MAKKSKSSETPSLESLFADAIENGVDKASLPTAYNYNVEELTYKVVPYHSYGAASAGRMNVVFEVSIWCGDPSVQDNAQIVCFTLWANYAITIPQWAMDNPTIVCLAQQLQFHILTAVTGK